MAENWLEMVEKQPFAFCVITFEPIEVQTHSAPQNDRLNLSFVKGIYVDGGKLARNGCKIAIRAVTIDSDPLVSSIVVSLVFPIVEQVICRVRTINSQYIF